MLINKPKELKFFTQPQSTLIHSLQEKNRDIYSSVNNFNYYPYQGA